MGEAVEAHTLTAPAPLALTQGDPSGIGPELTLKAWMARRARALPPFFVLADPAQLARAAAALGLEIALREVAPQEASAVFDTALPVVPLGFSVRGAPGAPDPADAAATIGSIERAVALVAEGKARALVTNPIAKNVLYAAGFAHPGHTEFLAALAERRFGRPFRPVMMLYAEELAVVPATIHVALAEVPRLLTRALLVETGEIVAADLAAPLRPRFAAARLRRAQSACRRERRHGPRGDRRHRPRRRRAARAGDRRQPARIRPTRCSTPPPARAMTSPFARRMIRR